MLIRKKYTELPVNEFKRNLALGSDLGLMRTGAGALAAKFGRKAF